MFSKSDVSEIFSSSNRTSTALDRPLPAKTSYLFSPDSVLGRFCCAFKVARLCLSMRTLVPAVEPLDQPAVHLNCFSLNRYNCPVTKLSGPQAGLSSVYLSSINPVTYVKYDFHKVQRILLQNLATLLYWLLITVTGWYRTKRRMQWGHFLVYYGSVCEF
jgi:hypothetical protein